MAQKPGKTGKIFISYRRRDSATAAALAKQLQRSLEGTIDEEEKGLSVRKPKGVLEVKDKSAVILHGQFLRTLRHRAELTCEELADRLEYKRPTQVIRWEAGGSGIALSEINIVAVAIMCSPKLLLFARIIAFETPYYDSFGPDLCKSMGFRELVTAQKFFLGQIEDIENEPTDSKKGIWHGSIAKLKNPHARPP
jgi:hypothetical protein